MMLKLRLKPNNMLRIMLELYIIHREYYIIFYRIFQHTLSILWCQKMDKLICMPPEPLNLEDRNHANNMEKVEAKIKVILLVSGKDDTV